MKKIILASSSPRRMELLDRMGIPYEVFPADIDESYPHDIDILDVSSFIAEKKVMAVSTKIKETDKKSLVLGADTVICTENLILGKPSDRNQAVEYLHLLQGKMHKTVSGIALFNGENETVTVRKSVNNVFFKSMTDDEIEWYVNTEEWKGAAGGYRIQGKASFFIEKIEGSYSSIMGLPLFELYDILRSQNYSFL